MVGPFTQPFTARQVEDLRVEILSVDDEGTTLDISVAVTTETTETIDYELNINDTGTGGTVTRSGTLVGGAGSFPGDSNIHDASFGIGDTTGGTVTAVITSPDRFVGAEHQDQRNWGSAGDDDPVDDEPAGVNINSCDSVASGDELSASYVLAPEGTAGVDTEVTIVVDGQDVGSANHFVPGRGGSFSQTIPVGDLPIGDDMPVEIEVDGNL